MSRFFFTRRSLSSPPEVPVGPRPTSKTERHGEGAGSKTEGRAEGSDENAAPTNFVISKRRVIQKHNGVYVLKKSNPVKKSFAVQWPSSVAYIAEQQHSVDLPDYRPSTESSAVEPAQGSAVVLGQTSDGVTPAGLDRPSDAPQTTSPSQSAPTNPESPVHDAYAVNPSALGRMGGHHDPFRVHDGAVHGALERKYVGSGPRSWLLKRAVGLPTAQPCSRPSFVHRRKVPPQYRSSTRAVSVYMQGDQPGADRANKPTNKPTRSAKRRPVSRPRTSSHRRARSHKAHAPRRRRGSRSAAGKTRGRKSHEVRGTKSHEVRGGRSHRAAGKPQRRAWGGGPGRSRKPLPHSSVAPTHTGYPSSMSSFRARGRKAEPQVHHASGSSSHVELSVPPSPSRKLILLKDTPALRPVVSVRQQQHAQLLEHASTPSQQALCDTHGAGDTEEVFSLTPDVSGSLQSVFLTGGEVPLDDCTQLAPRTYALQPQSVSPDTAFLREQEKRIRLQLWQQQREQKRLEATLARREAKRRRAQRANAFLKSQRSDLQASWEKQNMQRQRQARSQEAKRSQEAYELRRKRERRRRELARNALTRKAHQQAEAQKLTAEIAEHVLTELGVTLPTDKTTRQLFIDGIVGDPTRPSTAGRGRPIATDSALTKRPKSGGARSTSGVQRSSSARSTSGVQRSGSANEQSPVPDRATLPAELAEKVRKLRTSVGVEVRAKVQMFMAEQRVSQKEAVIARSQAHREKASP